MNRPAKTGHLHNMRTTIAIDKNVAQRVAEHGERLGNRSLGAMSEFLLRKACDLIDSQGVDAIINISSADNQCQEKTISRSAENY